MKEATLIALLIAIPIAAWGFAYEKAYFTTLGVDLPNDFSVYHYVLSGIIPLLVLVAIVMVLSAVKMFFTGIDTEREEGASLAAMVASAKLSARSDFKYAKFIFALCLSFPFFVYYWELLGLSVSNPGFTYYYFVSIAFGAFLWPLMVSAPHQKIPIALLMAASVAAVFVAGGIYDARADLRRPGPTIRDDTRVEVLRRGDGFISKPKGIKEWEVFKLLK